MGGLGLTEQDDSYGNKDHKDVVVADHFDDP
jgi:hypothetical protein